MQFGEQKPREASIELVCTAQHPSCSNAASLLAVDDVSARMRTDFLLKF